MKFTDYLKDKILLVIVQTFCIAAAYWIFVCYRLSAGNLPGDFTGLGRNIFRMVFMGILQQKTVLPANRNDFGKGG